MKTITNPKTISLIGFTLVSVSLLVAGLIDWKSALLIVFTPIVAYAGLYAYIMKVSREDNRRSGHWYDQRFAQQPFERRRAVINILNELDRAERKHPDWPTDYIHRAAIVQEEAGELIRATLQHQYENSPAADMQKEATQTGAMALRFLLKMRLVLLIAFAGTMNAQAPCDSTMQPIGYSVGCHTFCAQGTYNLDNSFCGWQRITAQNVDTAQCYFVVNGGPPTQTSSIVFTPTLPGITTFSLYSWYGSGPHRCYQSIAWSFTTVVCERGQVSVGLQELLPDQAQPRYFDLQGNPTEKTYNTILIEQVGLYRRKVVIFE